MSKEQLMQAPEYMKLLIMAGSVLSVFFADAAYADSSVALSGFLNNTSPSSLNATALQAFATSNPSAVSTITANGDTYTGVSLYSYLHSYVATDPTVPKNDIARDYISAGNGTSSIVYAFGALQGSGFGFENDILAFSDSKGTMTGPSIIAADGASVLDLTSINIGHVPYSGAGAAYVPTSFTLSGNIGNPATITAADLPNGSPTQEVTSFTPPLVGNTYTGVTIWDFLQQHGLTSDQNSLLNSFILLSGASGGYQAIIAMEEIMPQFGNQNDLVAYATGTGASLGNAGVAITVLPNDQKGGRYMQTMTDMQIVKVNAVPLPGSALLMLSGLIPLSGRLLRKR
jgi:hypothetical protein